MARVCSLSWGVFLAVQTWNIKLKQINDSHLIAVSIIAVFVGSVVGGLLAILLQESVDIAFILLGIVCILIGFFLLCLLYLPKVNMICLSAIAFVQTHTHTHTHNTHTHTHTHTHTTHICIRLHSFTHDLLNVMLTDVYVVCACNYLHLCICLDRCGT